jgi:hypothetical protein
MFSAAIFALAASTREIDSGRSDRSARLDADLDMALPSERPALPEGDNSRGERVFQVKL